MKQAQPKTNFPHQERFAKSGQRTTILVGDRKSIPPKYANVEHFLIIGWLMVAVIGWFPLGVHATEAAPILQLDTNGHMAQINNILFTQDGQHLVSAGDDKVIRIWDVNSGKTIRTIRGNIGSGNAGKVYAMALSPTNQWLAIAGWMAVYHGSNTQEVGAIRIYDFAKGTLAGLLVQHKNVVLSLAFSQDGTQLVSGSMDKTAIVWDVMQRQPLHILQGHQDAISVVAFSADGKRIITAGEDHELRLWQRADGRLLTRLQGHSGPVESMAVSSQDGIIASGGDDQTIRLWDDHSGALLKVLAKRKAEVSSLSFSSDGQYLLAGVGSGKHKDCLLYRVSDGKVTQRYYGHDNVVRATAIHPNGRIAATAGGSNHEIHLWMLQNGKRIQRLVGSGNSIWSVGFSKDGGHLAWGKAQPKKTQAPLQYTLRLPTAQQGLGAPRRLSTQKTFVRAIHKRGNWQLRVQSTKQAKAKILQVWFGDRVMATIKRGLKSGSGHWAYTFTQNGHNLISGGANGVLAIYDRSGKKLGNFIGHTNDIWSLAISPDGQWLASASADQTLRLWNLTSYELLLTLFHSNKDEWIAWTASGYYNTSVTGDRYIGWHQNRGLNKNADYFPAARFKAQRYQPELVADTLLLGSERQALQYQQKTPSRQEVHNIVQLIAQVPRAPYLLQTPQDEVWQAEQLLLISLDNKTEQLIVNLNGRPLTEARGLQRVKQTNFSSKAFTQDCGKARGLKRTKEVEGCQVERRVTLRPGKNHIELLARNAYGDSPKVLLVLDYQSSSKSVGSEDWRKPALYLLAVGVSDYEDHELTLRFAAQDAQAVFHRLKQEQGKNRLYRKVHAKFLSNQKATRSNIIDNLDIFNSMTEDDLAIIYIAGHGMTDNFGDFYFLPYEANRKKIQSTGIKWRIFKEVTRRLPGKVILIADACHSGDIYGIQGRRAVLDMTRLTREFFDAGTGVIVFASSQGKEFSEESPQWGHGAFTKALLDGLMGKADYTQDGVIHQSELETYVKRTVPTLTSGRQHPIVRQPDGIADFAIARVLQTIVK